MRRARTALIYADVDAGLIDGSAVWLASVTDLLARAGCLVTLQLRDRHRRDAPLLQLLHGRPNIRILEPFTSDRRWHGRLPARRAAAAAMLHKLDAREGFDLVLVRGMTIAGLLARSDEFRGRLWTYLTDIPQHVADLDDEVLADLDAIAQGSRVVLCQTEELRSYLESVVPAAVGRTELLPPVVPLPIERRTRIPVADRAIRLAYAGKFAPLWMTLEMTRLPARLAERGIRAELIMVGDKVHEDRSDPMFRDRMRAALERTPGVVWRGMMSREDAMNVVGTADFGLSWRADALSATLELSTKVLEYGVLDLPAIVNRTPMHERLLGVDYPLFASSEDDVVQAVVDAVADPSIRSRAAARVRAAAAEHTTDRGTARLTEIFARVFPPPLRPRVTGRSLRVGVASHDLKFFTAILRHLRSLPDVDVRIDHWTGVSSHDLVASQAMLDWADVIICEWCGPNAVWYSQRKRPGQRLIVRLHRFELDRPWPAQVNIDLVDRVVCVSRSYAALARQVTGWPSSKIALIPNWVDDVALDRPKLEGAQFHLGFIGMAPLRKRLDRALDVLESLRAADPRYRLFVKTKLTWDYPSIWRRPEERQHVDLIMRRTQTSQLLRGSVVFDDFGPDVGSWLRRIGFILSTSDDESFHLAPAEGMASGAVPAILDWPGAESIYGSRWIHLSTDAMARSIAAIVEQGRWEAERGLARSWVRDAFGVAKVCDAWGRLVDDPKADVDVDVVIA